MRKATLAVALFFVTTTAFAGAVNRSASVPLSGTVRDVVTISTMAVTLTGGSTFTQVFLDLETDQVGVDQAGHPVYKVVRLDCSNFLTDCRNLRKGDAINVTGGFVGLKGGYSSETTAFYITAPIQWQ